MILRELLCFEEMCTHGSLNSAGSPAHYVSCRGLPPPTPCLRLPRPASRMRNAQIRVSCSVASDETWEDMPQTALASYWFSMLTTAIGVDCKTEGADQMQKNHFMFPDAVEDWDFGSNAKAYWRGSDTRAASASDIMRANDEAGVHAEFHGSVLHPTQNMLDLSGLNLSWAMRSKLRQPLGKLNLRKRLESDLQ